MAVQRGKTPPAELFAGLLGALVTHALWIPYLLIATTLIVQRLVGSDNAHDRAVAIVIGLVVTLAAWLVLALLTRGGALAPGANTSSYERLRAIVADLRAELPAPVEGRLSTFRANAEGQLDEIDATLAERRFADLRWVRGVGYVELWRRTHSAEEALLKVASREYVVEAAVRVWKRLDGSEIKDKTTQSATLKKALAIIAPSAAAALDGTTSADKPESADASDATSMEARALIAETSLAVGEYREDKYAGLVAVRNLAAVATVVLGLLAYGLLSLSLIGGAMDGAVDAGVAFFLVGALVGLFGRIWADQGATKEVEDYGLSLIRLLQAPLLSGLAALIAVVLFPMLFAASIKEALDLSTDVPPKLRLSQVFDLTHFSFGVVLAAIFGLSPGALVDRLKQTAEDYKKDLLSTKAAGTS